MEDNHSPLLPSPLLSSLSKLPNRPLGPTIFTLPFPLQPNTLFSPILSFSKLNGALNLVFFTFQNDTILMDLMLWILGVDVDLNSKMSWF